MNNELCKKRCIPITEWSPVWFAQALIEMLHRQTSALEQNVAQKDLILTESQVATMERQQQSISNQEFETHHSSYLGFQETFHPAPLTFLLTCLPQTHHKFPFAIAPFPYQIDLHRESLALYEKGISFACRMRPFHGFKLGF